VSVGLRRRERGGLKSIDFFSSLLKGEEAAAGVDFVNILPSAFTHADPKRAKKTDGLTVFFAF